MAFADEYHALRDIASEKENVAESPDSGFGPDSEGSLRISLVENEERLRQAVRQIKRCLSDAEAESTDTAKQSAASP